MRWHCRGNKPENQRPERYRLGPRGEDVGALADLWVEAWQAVMPQINFPARRAWLVRCVADIEALGGTAVCAFDARDEVVGFFLLDLGRAYLEQIAIAPAQFGSASPGC